MMSPADLTDTGQWRLIIYISENGMCAFLKHLYDMGRPIMKLLSTSWTSHDPASLLSNIESAVYDSPTLLDDYATDIIIETPKVCFVPNSYLYSVDDAESDIYTALFPGAANEVLSDQMNDCTALFSLVRGIDGFFARTIPGARVRSHLAVLVENFSKIASADSPCVFADIRDSRLDLILFKGKKLFSASVQSWNSPEDIAYRIFNMLNAYDVNPALAKIYLSGSTKPIENLIPVMARYCDDVGRTPIPYDYGSDDPMPLAALLLTLRTSKSS